MYNQFNEWNKIDFIIGKQNEQLMSFIGIRDGIEMKKKTQQQRNDLDLAFVVVSTALLFYYSFGLFSKQRHIKHSVKILQVLSKIYFDFSTQ